MCNKRLIFNCIFKTMDIFYGCISCLKFCVYKCDLHSNNDKIELIKRRDNDSLHSVNSIDTSKNIRVNVKMESSLNNKVNPTMFRDNKKENKNYNSVNNDINFDNREQIIQEYVSKMVSNIIQNSIREVVKNDENSKDLDLDFDLNLHKDNSDCKLSDNEEIGIIDWIDNDDTVNVNIGFIKKYDRARMMRLKYEKYIDINDKKDFDNIYNNTTNFCDTFYYDKYGTKDENNRSSEINNFFINDLYNTRKAWVNHERRNNTDTEKMLF